MVSKLVLYILVDLDLDIQLKTNRVTFETDDAVLYSILIFLWKGLACPSLSHLEIASPPHFMYTISRKTFFMLYAINWPNFIAWLSLVLEILCNVCIVIICFPVIDVMNFEIILTSYQVVFLHDFLDNNLNILRTKGAFKMKYKALFINFKEISLKQIRPTSLEGESLSLSQYKKRFYCSY